MRTCGVLTCGRATCIRAATCYVSRAWHIARTWHVAPRHVARKHAARGTFARGTGARWHVAPRHVARKHAARGTFARGTCARWHIALCTLHVVAAPLSFQAGAATDPAAAAALERLLTRSATARQYSAIRRLEASGGGQRAWLDVRTDFRPGTGLRYDVTAEGGSGYIRARVLKSLLDEERSLIARDGAPEVAISRDNYAFSPERINDEGLAVIGLKPLRRERALIGGRMFVTLEGDLVRVEGRLAKNPSFWVSRATVVRSYRRVNGVTMPIALESRAELRLFGSSTLRMTYRYTLVDDRTVDDSLYPSITAR